ncbi:ImmA/IrrE family metallo-endopeptidase [Lachnospiraceae bacterium LCP19S3_B12]
MNIKARVRILMQKYRTRDPFDLARACGVILVYYPLKDVRGFYQYFKRNNMIYVDEMLPKFIQSLVAAHELGHMFLHKTANAIFMDTRTQFNTDKYEIQANKFAMELLIPDEVLLENWQLTTAQLSRLTGYSETLIKLRLQ